MWPVSAAWSVMKAIDSSPCLGRWAISLFRFLQDRHGNLWVGGSFGLLTRSPQGVLRHYTVQDGLPDNYIRSVWEDRDGNLWAGTDGGLARLENGRFVSSPLASSHEREWVRCIYEDTEGNLWVGMNSGLNRLRNDLFSMYGESEGLPSDEPTTVYQDHRGRIWVGFHGSGLVQLVDGNRRGSIPKRTACRATRFSPFARTGTATC